MGGAEQHELYPTCAIPKGFLSELRRYEVLASLDGGPLPDEYSLCLNDVPIQRFDRRTSSTFPFEMDFYAGDLRLTVTCGVRVVHALDAYVDPDIAKLTRNEYAAMMADLAEMTPAIYRLGMVTLSAPTSSHSPRSDLVTLELIRSSFNAFDRATSRIADGPLRTLRTTVSRSDILRARRVEDRAIEAALRRGRTRLATSAEAEAAPRLVGALGGRWIPTIDETKRQETADIYENRAIVGFMRWLDGVLSDLARRLSIVPTSQMASPTVASHLARIARWHSKLALIFRRSAFVGLQADHYLRATSIFRTHPDYASAFTAMSRMRAGLGIGGIAEPALPLERTFELYELWCYIGILRAVTERFPHTRSQVRTILHACQSPSSLGMVLASGQSSEIPISNDIKLSYQRRFSPTVATDGCRTHLIEAVPDINFCKSGVDGKCTSIVIFDPKYRAGSSLLDGIRDMHVYRDAILNSAGRRLVAAAVALAPRCHGFVESITYLPQDRPGIVSARPGHDPDVFNRLLDLALARLAA